jgi:hypothetical protein
MPDKRLPEKSEKTHLGLGIGHRVLTALERVRRSASIIACLGPPDGTTTVGSPIAISAMPGGGPGSLPFDFFVPTETSPADRLVASGQVPGPVRRIGRGTRISVSK